MALRKKEPLLLNVHPSPSQGWVCRQLRGAAAFGGFREIIFYPGRRVETHGVGSVAAAIKTRYVNHFVYRIDFALRPVCIVCIAAGGAAKGSDLNGASLDASWGGGAPDYVAFPEGPP